MSPCLRFAVCRHTGPRNVTRHSSNRCGHFLTDADQQRRHIMALPPLKREVERDSASRLSAHLWPSSFGNVAAAAIKKSLISGYIWRFCWCAYTRSRRPKTDISRKPMLLCNRLSEIIVKAVQSTGRSIAANCARRNRTDFAFATDRTEATRRPRRGRIRSGGTGATTSSVILAVSGHIL